MAPAMSPALVPRSVAADRTFLPNESFLKDGSGDEGNRHQDSPLAAAPLVADFR
jgi:hypothetical protein